MFFPLKKTLFWFFWHIFSWPIESSVEYLNRGPPIKFLSLKSNSPHVYAVEELVNILDKLNVKTIIKIELNVEQIVDALMNTSLKERVSPNVKQQSSELVLHCVLGKDLDWALLKEARWLLFWVSFDHFRSELASFVESARTVTQNSSSLKSNLQIKRNLSKSLIHTVSTPSPCNFKTKQSHKHLFSSRIKSFPTITYILSFLYGQCFWFDWKLIWLANPKMNWIIF